MPEKKALRLTFFVIEDEPAMLDLMAAILESRGHTVVKHVAAAYAIPELRKEPPDAIVVDIMMSELNGVEFLSETKKIKALSRTALIAVSALDDPIWKKKALDAGADAYLTKPIDVNTFGLEVERIIAAK